MVNRCVPHFTVPEGAVLGGTAHVQWSRAGFPDSVLPAAASGIETFAGPPVSIAVAGKGAARLQFDPVCHLAGGGYRMCCPFDLYVTDGRTEWEAATRSCVYSQRRVGRGAPYHSQPGLAAQVHLDVLLGRLGPVFQLRPTDGSDPDEIGPYCEDRRGDLIYPRRLVWVGAGSALPTRIVCVAGDVPVLTTTYQGWQLADPIDLSFSWKPPAPGWRRIRLDR